MESAITDLDAVLESEEPFFVVEDSKEASLKVRRVDDHLVADFTLHYPDSEDEIHTLPFVIVDGRWWPDEWIV